MEPRQLTGKHATDISDVGLKHRDALVGNCSSGEVDLRHTLQNRVDNIGRPHEDGRVQAIDRR